MILSWDLIVVAKMPSNKKYMRDQNNFLKKLHELMMDQDTLKKQKKKKIT